MLEFLLMWQMEIKGYRHKLAHQNVRGSQPWQFHENRHVQGSALIRIVQSTCNLFRWPSSNLFRFGRTRIKKNHEAHGEVVFGKIREDRYLLYKQGGASLTSELDTTRENPFFWWKHLQLMGTPCLCSKPSPSQWLLYRSPSAYGCNLGSPHPSSGCAAATGAPLTHPLEGSLPTCAMETRIPCLILP